MRCNKKKRKKQPNKKQTQMKQTITLKKWISMNIFFWNLWDGAQHKNKHNTVLVTFNVKAYTFKVGYKY